MAKKTNNDTIDPLHGGRVQVPRSRGAVSGILLLILGAWGALIPFIGPWFSFGYTPDESWHWTAARGWLEVLPGAGVLLGALLLMVSANRITASLGGWLALAGGAWFIVGLNFTDLLDLGSVGTPRGNSKAIRLIENLSFFDGLGALILFLAAGAIGRLSVRSVRDVRAAQRREIEDEVEQRRIGEYEAARQRDLDSRMATTEPTAGRLAAVRPAGNQSTEESSNDAGPRTSQQPLSDEPDVSNQSATSKRRRLFSRRTDHSEQEVIDPDSQQTYDDSQRTDSQRTGGATAINSDDKRN